MRRGRSDFYGDKQRNGHAEGALVDVLRGDVIGARAEQRTEADLWWCLGTARRGPERPLAASGAQLAEFVRCALPNRAECRQDD